MKKIVLSIAVIVFLSASSLTAFAKPRPTVFTSFSTLTFSGDMRSANVSALSVGNRSKRILYHGVHNRSGAANMRATFNNLSNTMTGAVSFDTDGVWLGFNGSFLLKQAEHVIRNGGVSCTGVIRVNKNDTVSYNPLTGAFTGNGEVVEFSGTIKLAGVVRRGAGRAMLKVWINPGPATKKSVFFNGTTASFGNGTSVAVRMSVPAVQLINQSLK